MILYLGWTICHGVKKTTKMISYFPSLNINVKEQILFEVKFLLVITIWFLQAAMSKNILKRAIKSRLVKTFSNFEWCLKIQILVSELSMGIVYDNSCQRKSNRMYSIQNFNSFFCLFAKLIFIINWDTSRTFSSFSVEWILFIKLRTTALA